MFKVAGLRPADVQRKNADNPEAGTKFGSGAQKKRKKEKKRKEKQGKKKVNERSVRKSTFFPDGEEGGGVQVQKSPKPSGVKRSLHLTGIAPTGHQRGSTEASETRSGEGERPSGAQVSGFSFQGVHRSVHNIMECQWSETALVRKYCVLFSTFRKSDAFCVTLCFLE